MSGGDFLDSNVFVYLVDPDNAAKRRIAEDLVLAAVASGSTTISFQVVQETLNVMTRGLRTVVTVVDARRFLADVLVPLWRVMPTRALYERALDVHGRYGYSYYDSLIIAAAHQSGRDLSEGWVTDPEIPHSQRLAMNFGRIIEHAAEPSPKTTAPITNSRFRPKMSASRPAADISDAKASRYAAMTHCTSDEVESNSRWMAGSAVTTAVSSRKARPIARLVATRTQRCAGVTRGSVDAASGATPATGISPSVHQPPGVSR